MLEIKPKPKKKKHNFNLRSLEDDALLAYKNWKEEDNASTRQEVFLTIQSLAYAVAKISHWIKKFELDPDKLAYEYALYLFERIITGRFKMEPKDGDRMPIQKYISQNIRHIVMNLSNEKTPDKNLLDDMEFLLEKIEDPNFVDAQNNFNKTISRNTFAVKLLNFIKLYYPLDEIKRLYNLSTDLIYNNKKIYEDNYPQDIKDFSTILIAGAKRIYSEERSDDYFKGSHQNLNKALASAARSSIFLSTVVNSKFFPQELLLSLDLSSLYRLVYLLGGQTIKIPSIRELDTLLGTVVTVSKVIMEGKDPQKTLHQSKSDMDLVFSNNINIREFINKAVKTYNVTNEESESEPLLNILLTCIKSLEPLFNKMIEESKGNPEELIQAYSELVDSSTKFTQSIMSISKGIGNEFKEIKN